MTIPTTITKITVQLFTEDAEVFETEFDLIERIQSDAFVTIWQELDMYDSDYYDSIRYEKSYLKVMKVLDSSNNLIYSGVPLDVHELQCKLKHMTRIDKSLKKIFGGN